MVLLNPQLEAAYEVLTIKLTFHYGAIEPSNTTFNLTCSNSLTFHYGAIEPTFIFKDKLIFIKLTFHYGAIEPR